MDRIKTGTDGLDNLIGGGVPAGSSVLVTGTCGTGKSILSLQYIYKGALLGEPGLYVTFEESLERLVAHGKQFGWDIQALVDKKLMEIYTVEIEDMSEILKITKDKIDAMGAKRLAVDSLTTMMEHGIIYRSKVSKEMDKMFAKSSGFDFPPDTAGITRKDVYHIVKQINKMGTTSFLISEVAEKSNYLSRDTISEFAVDGVILLEVNTVGGSPERLLSVKKMRGTPLDLRMSIMEFTQKGIVLRE